MHRPTEKDFWMIFNASKNELTNSKFLKSNADFVSTDISGKHVPPGAWGHRSKLSAFPDNTYRALQIYFCLGENRI